MADILKTTLSFILHETYRILIDKAPVYNQSAIIQTLSWTRIGNLSSELKVFMVVYHQALPFLKLINFNPIMNKLSYPFWIFEFNYLFIPNFVGAAIQF